MPRCIWVRGYLAGIRCSGDFFLRAAIGPFADLIATPIRRKAGPKKWLDKAAPNLDAKRPLFFRHFRQELQNFSSFDLAEVSSWNSFYENYFLRNLDRLQSLPAMSLQRLRESTLILNGVWGDGSAHALISMFIRQSDDRRFFHVRMKVQDAFHFERLTLHAVNADLIVDATLHGDEPVFIHHAEVSGVQPSFIVYARAFVFSPVTRHDVWPFNADLPGACVLIPVCDFQRDSFRRSSRASQFIYIPVIKIVRAPARFGQSVIHVDARIGEQLQKASGKLFRHRRAIDNDITQLARPSTN